MKKNAIVFLIMVSLFVSGCSCARRNNTENNNGDDATIITNENVVGEQTVEGIALENTTFQVQDGITTLVTKVTNRTGSEFVLENYQMIVTDKNGDVLTILTSTVNETLANDEEKSYAFTFNLDLSSAVDVEYKVNVPITE